MNYQGEGTALEGSNPLATVPGLLHTVKSYLGRLLTKFLDSGKLRVGLPGSGMYVFGMYLSVSRFSSSQNAALSKHMGFLCLHPGPSG